MEPGQKQHSVVNVTDDWSKIQCYKEQYYIGTWDVRSMNQGKLNVVKQDTAGVNTEILGISKWTEMDWNGWISLGSPLYLLLWARIPWKKWGSHHRQQKSPKCSIVLVCSLKNDRMISVHFQSKPFNVTVIQVYAPTSKAEEAPVEQFCEDLQDHLELTNQKRCPFHHRQLECKSRKSRNTWSNRQIWPWNMEWSRAKAKSSAKRTHTGHSKQPLPATQEMTLHMDITRWSIPKSDWLYSL